MTIHWHKSIIITLVGVLFLLAGCAVTCGGHYCARFGCAAHGTASCLGAAPGLG